MLAKAVDTLPDGADFFTNQWDGFRAIVFHGGTGVHQSRDLRP
jgi:hypothetical protein